MSTSVDFSQNPRISPASPCFDIQEFRSRSQASDDSFEDFLPAIEVMSFCTQLSKHIRAFGKTEKRRVRFALIPAVFGVDGSSPPRVSSWGYKPVGFPDSKESWSKRRRPNVTKMKRMDQSSWDTHEHSQRWGYSSPAFHCRSPPAHLYKYRNSLKLEQSSTDQCDVPGVTVQQAILFRRTFSTKFLANNQELSRKHNNTPVCLEAVPQKSLKKHVSMPDLKYIQTGYGGRERKESVHCGSLRQSCKNENRRVKPQKEIVANEEDNIPGAKCPLCISESQDIKKNLIHAKKIDIKLPCLDTNQEA